MTQENVHTAPKHPRGSSPPENVEEIYRAWLQRPAAAPEQQTPVTPPSDGTGSGVPGDTPGEPADPARP